MVRLKHKLIEPTPAPERGVKAATLRLLLETAMTLIQQNGHVPSVAEVAARSNVSRATTYRYFPTRSALVTAVVDSSLGPVRAFASREPDGRARLHELFAQTFPRFQEFEPQMRAAAQLALEQWALERAGLLEEEPYRRGHRIRILEHAMAPLAATLPAAIRDRLHRALSVVYGIEPYMVLKDIWGLPDREVERVALWMADALIDAAQRDAAKAHAARPGAAMPPAWFDAQYDNRARIAEHPAILREWDERSRHARSSLACTLDVAYGDAASERLDVFTPAAPSAGGVPVLVYLHGGYWRALDKRDQSFVAAPFVAAGAMVVLPNYALCPSVAIDDIVLQLVQALAWVWRHAAEHGGDPSRIVVAGHSAGGHLAAMLLGCEWRKVAPDLPADLVSGALAVSGVFDLEPLRHAPFLAPDLKLDAASARRLSPIALPAPRGPLFAVVGGDESEEFLRQNAAIEAAWGRRAVPVCEQVPGRHHMNVLHELAEAGSRTHCHALRLLGLSAPDLGGFLGRSKSCEDGSLKLTRFRGHHPYASSRGTLR